MGFIGGMILGGLLGAYWTRPGGWLSGIYGGARQMPASYYYRPMYYAPMQYRNFPQYNYSSHYYPRYYYPY